MSLPLLMEGLPAGTGPKYGLSEEHGSQEVEVGWRSLSCPSFICVLDSLSPVNLDLKTLKLTVPMR